MSTVAERIRSRPPQEHAGDSRWTREWKMWVRSAWFGIPFAVVVVVASRWFF